MPLVMPKSKPITYLSIFDSIVINSYLDGRAIALDVCNYAQDAVLPLLLLPNFLFTQSGHICRNLTDLNQLAAEKSYPLESSKPRPFFPPVDCMIFEDEVILSIQICSMKGRWFDKCCRRKIQ